MKIKLDENLPARLRPVLERHGHEVHTVPEENLAGRPENEIWQAVCTEGRFLITQDLDFSNSRQFAPGSTKESCWSDCVNPGPRRCMRLSAQ